jgi:hypothetical protein
MLHRRAMEGVLNAGYAMRERRSDAKLLTQARLVKFEGAAQ